jgi:iron complex outermembrane receptor protein
MQVLIDGRSIYEPFFGGIIWKAIPVNINDIERIEVSRGPNLATYGSNSFMAAINIITRTAAEDQGAFIQSNVGNNDIADLTYRYGNSSGNLDYRITASTFNDSGLDSANAFDHPDDSHSNNIDYRLDYQLDNKNRLSYQGGYGENRQQTDRNHEDVLPTARTVENTRLFQFIKWENTINSENTLQVQYYYNLSDKKDFYTSDAISIPVPALSTFADPFTLDLNASIKAERHNLELTHFIYPDKNLKLVWGLSAQTDFAQSLLYLGNNDTVSHKQYRGFANIEWHIDPKNTVNIGALAEKNDYSKTELSPRLSLTHAFNRQHKVRVGFSQAIRSPFIFEAIGDVSYSQELTIGGVPIGTVRDQVLLGNQDLLNEEITSREIAYFGEFLNSALLFNARVFHDDVTNYIDTLREVIDPTIDNIPDVLIFQNPISSSTSGLELELDYHIDSTLRLIASGAIINITSNSQAMALSAPQHSFSLIASKRFNEKYNGSMAYYYVEDFNWTDSSGIDAYRTLDLRLSRNFKFNQTHSSLSVVLKNLLDDYSDYKETPRNTTAPKVVQSTLAYIDYRINF